MESWRTKYVGQVPQSVLDNMSVDERENAWKENLVSTELKTIIAEVSGRVVGFTRFGKSRDDDSSQTIGGNSGNLSN